MNDDHDLLIMLLLLAAFAFLVWLDHVDGPLLESGSMTFQGERQ